MAESDLQAAIFKPEVHIRCKKSFAIFLSPAGMSLTKVNYSCPGRVWSVTSRLGTGKSLIFFLQCTCLLFPFTKAHIHCKATIPKIRNKYSPEKELCGLSPNFHIHVSVGDLYIPMIGLPILLQENMWTDYPENRSQTHECGKWDRGRAISRKGIHKWDFRCSVLSTPIIPVIVALF